MLEQLLQAKGLSEEALAGPHWFEREVEGAQVVPSAHRGAMSAALQRTRPRLGTAA